jgi:hypothetical protein
MPLEILQNRYRIKRADDDSLQHFLVIQRNSQDVKSFLNLSMDLLLIASMKTRMFTV